MRTHPTYRHHSPCDAETQTASRNEYLGPAPHVTGYRFDAAERTARIEWWDPYVRTLWVGRGTWGVELYFDEAVRGWVSRPRGDFDPGVDLERYMGP